MPLAVVLIVVVKLFQLGRAIMTPVAAFFSIEGQYAWVFLDVISAVFLVAVCLLLGRLSQTEGKLFRFNALDDFLVDYFPRYSVLRSFLRDTGGSAKEVVLPDPVLYRSGDTAQLSFEIERKGDLVTLYVPDAPSVYSGAVVIAKSEQVLPLQATASETAGLVRDLGRGMLARLPEKPLA